MRSSACAMRRPSGVGMRNVSSAPNARLWNSIAREASSSTRTGFTVRYPSGMGLTFCAMASSSTARPTPDLCPCGRMPF